MKRAAILYIDDRERAITAHREVFGEHPVNISRMTVGDYAICIDDSVVAILERKTIEDLAASIKDGRYDNKQSLIDLRERSGCRVYYVVEGKPPKDPTHRVGGIPWTCLESALDHMTIRDGFNMLFTRDPLDTARRLARLVRSVQTLANKGEIEVTANGAVGLLTEKREIRDEDVVRSMWCKFRGIAATTADVFMKRYSLRDIVRGGIDAESLSRMTMPDGRCVSKRVLTSLGKIDDTTSVNILSCIPGVSKKTAQDLLKGRTLSQLLSYPVGAVSIIKVGRPAKNFGDVRAGRIEHYFSYRLPENAGVVQVDAQRADANRADTQGVTVHTVPCEHAVSGTVPIVPDVDPAAIDSLFTMLENSL
jgi:ERCC4-type nuclease